MLLVILESKQLLPLNLEWLYCGVCRSYKSGRYREYLAYPAPT